MKEKTTTICDKKNCVFANCVSICDGTDGVDVCPTLPCEAFGDCPKKFGLKN